MMKLGSTAPRLSAWVHKIAAIGVQVRPFQGRRRALRARVVEGIDAPKSVTNPKCTTRSSA
jgi:hypothetical protein